MSEKKDYIRHLYAPETSNMTAARTRIEQNDFPIFIDAIDGKLLSILMQMNNVKTCIEVGTLGGYSTLWLAEGLAPGGHIYTCEHDEKRFEMARVALDTEDNITLIKGDAKDTLLPLGEEKGPFDMIFIDADKKSYHLYLDWAEKYIRKGGLIVVDDTLLEGAVYMDHLPGRVRKSTAETLKAVNKRLADPAKYKSILLPTDAGLTIALKLF